VEEGVAARALDLPAARGRRNAITQISRRGRHIAFLGVVGKRRGPEGEEGG